jgi:hypothetical protein
LVFTICRPREKTIDIDSASWNGDIRERYSSALVSRRVLLKVPEHIQFFTVLFMLGCKKELSEKYPELFSKTLSKVEDDPVEDLDNGSDLEPSIISWLKLIKAVAETGIYGNYEETCHTNLHTFCLNVCFDIEKNEKMKQNTNLVNG